MRDRIGIWLLDYSKKMATSLIRCLYPPPQQPAGPGQNVPVQAGVVLLGSGNEGGLCDMGMSTGAF